MITRNRYNLQGDTNYQGLSTDQKPRHGVATNSMMLELDTGYVYYCEKGSIDKPRVTVLPESAFVGEATEEAGIYSYSFNGIDKPDDEVTVIFDGALYDSTGAKFPEDDEEWDFSEFPYSLVFLHIGPISADIMAVFVPNNDEHTIEVFTEGEPAVWKKIGE